MERQRQIVFKKKRIKKGRKKKTETFMVLHLAADAQQLITRDAAVYQRLILMPCASREAFLPCCSHTGCDVSRDAGSAVEEGEQTVVTGSLDLGMHLLAARAHRQGAVQTVGLSRKS